MASLAVTISYFNQVFKNASFSSRDFFDIIIVTFLVYTIVGFLRQTHSLPVFIGVSSLVTLYLITLFFDLPLTNLILKNIFAIFFIFLAIIFQKELRRFFSSFGSIGFTRRKLLPSETTVDVISDVVFEMAKRGIGGIIVFPGRESIERYLEGGLPLNGIVSEELILSIFDDTSPGHDGALIIEGNRVKKFAVHLPLADKIEKVKKFGLRHRAALGLSERTNAFVIVVSEERHMVTVARNGEFFSIIDKDDLKKRLAEFLEENFPTQKVNVLKLFFVRNILTLSLSLIISVIIWFLTNSQFTLVQKNFLVSPEIKSLSSEYLVSKISPSEITLTIKGRSFAFESLRRENLKILLDLSSIQKTGWHKITILPSDVRLPIGFSLIKFEPKSVSIQIIEKSSYHPTDEKNQN